MNDNSNNNIKAEFIILHKPGDKKIAVKPELITYIKGWSDFDNNNFKSIIGMNASETNVPETIDEVLQLIEDYNNLNTKSIDITTN